MAYALTVYSGMNIKEVCRYMLNISASCCANNSVSLYRKLDDLLIDPYNNPKFYEKLIRYFSERMLETIRQFVKAGADIICCGGNVGNATMVGPRFFKDFIKLLIILYKSKFRW